MKRRSFLKAIAAAACITVSGYFPTRLEVRRTPLPPVKWRKLYEGFSDSDRVTATEVNAMHEEYINNTSIWLVEWGDDKVHSIYPKSPKV